MKEFQIVLLVLMICVYACADVVPVDNEIDSHVLLRSAGAFINLGDYAKGDGTDETAAIQAAFDAIPPADNRPHGPREHPGAVLFIPRPEEFYGISDTIRVIEKWNVTIICETLGWGTREQLQPAYFRWLGPDNKAMFNFAFCKGMRIENLSLCGMDENSLQNAIDSYGWEVPAGHRLTNGVIGIVFGPDGGDQELSGYGFQNSMLINNLVIKNVARGMYLARYPNPDMTEFSFRNTRIIGFSEYGVITGSGNLACITFDTIGTTGAPGAMAAFEINAGEILLLNWTGSSAEECGPAGNAEIIVNAGGIHIIKAWSEWWGPFLRTSSRGPELGYRTGGSVNFPIILEGVRHYDGAWLAVGLTEGEEHDPVPTSVVYDQPVPLHLIGCSLWGDVELGSTSQSTIVDHGTVFVNKNCPGFVGEGATEYGRVIHIGTRSPDNARILQPYIVDRRSVPGTAAPTSGVWQRGDGVVNTEPDVNVPSKAWRGWLCIEGGEPGQWAPYGAIGSAVQP